MIILKMWRKTFSKENFGLRYSFPYHFAMSIFQKKPRVTVSWVVYRGFMAFYFTITLTYACSCIDEEWFKHFIYLTYWTYILETLMFNLGFIVALKLFRKQRNRALQFVDLEEIYRQYSDAVRKSSKATKSSKRHSKDSAKLSKVVAESTNVEIEKENETETGNEKETNQAVRKNTGTDYGKQSRRSTKVSNVSMSEKSSTSQHLESAPPKVLPLYIKFFWILYILVLPVAIGITFIFWILLYNPEQFPSVEKNVILHFFNSFFIVIDFILVAHPIKILHFYMPGLYGLVYILFTLVYQLSGGTGTRGNIPIYKILDWRYPVKTCITVVMCTLFVVILHFVLAFLDLIKVPIRYRKRHILDVV